MDRTELKKICRVIEITALFLWTVTGSYPDLRSIKGVVSEHMYQTAQIYSVISFIAIVMLAHCIESLLMETLTKRQFVLRTVAYAVFAVVTGVLMYFI